MLVNDKNYTKGTVDNINKAADIAVRLKTEVLTSDHIFLSLLADPVIKRILEESLPKMYSIREIDILDIKSQLEGYIRSYSSFFEVRKEDLKPSQDVTNVLTIARISSLSKDREGKLTNLYDLLIAFTDSKMQSTSGYSILYRLGVTKEILEDFEKKTDFIRKGLDNEEQEEKKYPFDLDFLIDLNEEVRKGRIDLLIGRDKEIDRVVHVLSKKKKNNAVLVGEPGVGKTAIAEGLAHRIESKDVPESMKDFKVIAIDLGAMKAGTGIVGTFEEKVQNLKKVMEKDDHNSIFFVDEIHTLLGTGAGNSALDISNMLKPTLARGRSRVVGATTYKEYKNIFEKDGALSRRFDKVEVKEPSLEEAKDILKGLRASFEKHHGVSYSEEAINQCVEMSARYINNRFLPDKAIDIMDEAGAFVKLRVSEDKNVTEDIVGDVVSRIAKIPSKIVNSSEKDKLKDLELKLKSSVYGQDDVIEEVCQTLIAAKAGLRDEGKPIGSFIFSGTTGVGKTEIAKKLAEEMSMNFLRIDMSEYQEKHTVSKLIGAPPGYVGFDEGGVLVDGVDKNPSSVLLLDEFEKAHPDIHDLLLQILDHGKMTNHDEKKIDFKNCIVICTTNLGAGNIHQNRIGISQTNNSDTDATLKNALKKALKPELLARFDKVCTFKSLDLSVVDKVLMKEIKILNDRLSKKNIELEYSKEAFNFIKEKGYNKAMGARNMQQTLNRLVVNPVSNQLVLNDKLENGGKIIVDLEGEKGLVFKFKEN